MNKWDIYILGVYETCGSDSAKFVPQNEKKMFYSGNLNKNHRTAVGVIMKNHT